MTTTFKELADGLRDAALGPEGGRREFIAACSKNADAIIEALERAERLEDGLKKVTAALTTRAMREHARAALKGGE